MNNIAILSRIVAYKAKTVEDLKELRMVNSNFQDTVDNYSTGAWIKALGMEPNKVEGYGSLKRDRDRSDRPIRVTLDILGQPNSMMMAYLNRPRRRVL